MPYNDLVTREGGAAELPKAVVDQVLADVERESTVMGLARIVRTATRDSRIAVMTELPSAYWVNGDAGLKQTSGVSFENQAVIAEELAVIIPVPDNVISDADIPIWDLVMPRIVQAMGKRLDDAVIFGINRPATWTSPALVPDAIAQGNVVTASADPAADLLLAAEMVAESGYVPTSAVVRPGWQYNASARRTQALTSNPVGERAAYALSVGGLAITTDPITWDRSVAEALVCDWRNVVIGIREDVRLEVFREGVISDETGKVVLNLMQQDTSAIRATFRVGALLAKPATSYGTGGSPVAIVSPSSVYAS